MNDLAMDLESPDPEIVYSAMIDAGKQRRLDLRAQVERFLPSTTPFLREAALKVVAFYWRLPEHKTTATRALTEDPDHAVRAAAAMGLGGYAKGESDALQLLLKVTLDAAEDDSVRDAAFTAALVVAGVSREDYPRERMIPGLEERAPWPLLLRSVEACGASVPGRLRALAALTESIDRRRKGDR